MQFDIIEVPEEELKRYNATLMRLMRNAQQKKDKLVHDAERELEE